MQINTTYNMDALAAARLLPDDCVDCIVTSPPYYGLRDYGVDGQIGLEETPEVFIDQLVTVFRELRRALKPEGTLWVNMGDSYNSYKGNAVRKTHKRITPDIEVSQFENPDSGWSAKI